MGRPRKTGDGLPSGVYFKHGAYYQVVCNRWHRLGTSVDSIGSPLTRLQQRLSPTDREILAWAYKGLTRARQNARGRRGIEFSITRENVHRMLNEAGWRCAVTGHAFSLEDVNRTKPFAPSIDRRDSRIGYIPENCRMVCVATNFAMNVWGEEVLWRLFSRRGVLDASKPA